jgi:iron-sulfur cluster repair protein YtfE (RIC family)
MGTQDGEIRARDAKRALLSRFHAEHEALRRLVDALAARIHEVAAGGPSGAERALARAEVQAMIDELEARLSRHFADEERVGFLSHAVDQAPRLSRRAESLRAESQAIARWLATLGAHTRNAGSTRRRWQQLDVACHRFAEVFHEHEYSENALICEAWVEDIGAVD